MKKDSKIYVAGHTGLVGSALTRVLTAKGYNNLTLKTIDELDLTEKNRVDDFFTKERPEYVFIAAAKVGGIVANNTLRADFILINLMIQNNVISAAWKYGVKKLLFLGSTCIYPKNAPQPIKEDYLLTSPLEYTNEPYAIAKIAGLKLCESFNNQYHTDFISVMPTNLYGLADNYDLEKSHVLPALLRKFHLGKCIEKNDWESIRKDIARYPVENITSNSNEKEILSILKKYGIIVENVPGTKKNQVSVSIWGSGNPFREFMYSQDMAEACLFIMENITVNDIIKYHSLNSDSPDYHSPHFINIGTSEEISIKDLAFKIKKLTDFNGEVVFDASKPDGTPRKITDTSALKSLGFKPKTDLDEGLRKTYEEYMKYGI
jgi:GDP-L-fucose synthase